MAKNDVSDAGLYAAEDALPALPWASRLVVAGAVLVALALLAAVLAYWGWRWFGPAPGVLPPPVAESDPLRRIAEAHLFGGAAPIKATGEPSSAGDDLRLLGVFAERDGRGYALFRAGARGPLFAAVGTDVAPGVHLEAVRPEGVTLREGGVRRDLSLRSAAARERPSSAAASVGTKSATCNAPAGFNGPIVRLNAELLSGMIGAPDTWKALVQPGPGGLIVRDQSGFAGMMGLRNGDRVERANGIALALPEDIAATVLKPLTRSQPVWVSGSRDGRPAQWLYLNAGACPG